MSKARQITPVLFEKFLNRLMELVSLGKAHTEIGRGLGRDIGADPAIANVAPVFWGTTITAHLDTAQLIAFKLFDPQKRTMTVEYLLEHAAEIQGSFAHATPAQVDAIIKIARAQIANLDAPLTKIRTKRNRMLAHLDPTTVQDPVRLSKQVELTFSDLNLVLSTAGDILNELSRGFRDSMSFYDIVSADDYKNAIGLIADAKCAQIRAYEAEFGLWELLRPKKCPKDEVTKICPPEPDPDF